MGAIGQAISPAALRTPPHSVEAEHSTLGSLLNDGTALALISDVVSAADFFRHEHRLIFGAITHLAGQGQPVDMITVFERLQVLGQVEDVGGLPYLNQLCESVTSSRNVRRYAEIVAERSTLRRLISTSDEIAAAAFNPQGRTVADIVSGCLAKMRQVAVAAHADGLGDEPPASFAVVPFADLATVEPAPPAYVWAGLVPAGHVTLLSAHGGTGKSLIALMLAVAVALGLPLFGIPTRRGVVAFYSGEDGAGLLRYRLRLVCHAMGVQVEDLAGRLFILDATDDDPTLFAEVTAGGRREGMTTATYAGLRDFAAMHAVSLLVVDNASDAFDASEIDRARVRGFMRALARLARERDSGVLLLAHVDKGTSRGDRGPNSEGYSGSTAWHNSARSRLFMARDKDGALTLEHQKHNLGKLREPLHLVWPEGGIPQLDEPVSGPVQGISDRTETRALLALLHEFFGRGEYVACAQNSTANAARVLSSQKGYPKRKPAEVFDLMRTAERQGLIERQSYRTADRKPRERWGLTTAGCDLIGVTAPTSVRAPPPHTPRCALGALGAPVAPAAPCDPNPALGALGALGAEATL